MLTEEEVKFRVLAPWLQAIGVSPERIVAEQSFRLFVGRHVIDKKNDDGTIGARLDLLIKNDLGKNLFIVESKAPAEAITTEDVDQGISYARLLREIAPFVVVTNGLESRLYDSITRERLTDEGVAPRYAQWQRGAVLNSADDIRIRAEALESFLSYSLAHVRAFSTAQVAAALERLRGRVGNSAAKYLPEVYEPRRGVGDALQAFLKVNSPIFVLAGESGVGKTNELCVAAEDLSKDYLAFFFAAGSLYGVLADRIADEFNWHFSEHLSVADVARRLARLADRSQTRVVLLFDAIDEYPAADAGQQFADLARRLQAFPTVRLVVSVKSSDWNSFAFCRGTPTALADCFGSSDERKGRETFRAQPSIILEPFDSEEGSRAEARYRAAFAYHGQLSLDLAKAVRDPFLLRVLGETYAGAEVPIDTRESELIGSYIDAKLDTASETTRDSISELAERIAEQYLTRVPSRDITRSLKEAERCGLVRLERDERGREWASFTFERVRDFIVAFEVFRLDTLQPPGLGETLCRLARTPTGRSAVRFFLIGCSVDGQQDAVAALIEKPAGEFLATYGRIRGECSPLVRRRMASSREAGALTLLYGVGAHGWWVFAFSPWNGAPTARDDTLVDWMATGGRSQGVDRPRVGMVHGREIWALLENPQLLAAQLAHKEILEVIEGCGLDESHSEILTTERICAIVSSRRTQLGIRRATVTFNACAQAGGLDLPPLDVESTRRALHARLASDEAWYRHASDPLELRHAAAEAARQRALNGVRFQQQSINRSEPWEALEEVLNAAEALNLRTIRPGLPSPDVLHDGQTSSLHWVYSDEKLKQVIAWVLTTTSSELRTLARRNLGGCANVLSPEWQPRTTIVHFERKKGDPFSDDGLVRYAATESVSPGEVRAVTIIDGRAITVIDGRWPRRIRARRWRACIGCS